MYKISKNEPCPCGSGRKYKHCCATDPQKDERIQAAASRAATREELVALLNRPPEIYRLRVKLDSMSGLKPDETVSRTFEIEGENSLFDLHLEIQSAFGWDNDHPYSFYMSNKVGDQESDYAGDPLGDDLDSPPWGVAPRSAAGTEIRDLGLKKGDRFKYVFDYGDYLVHSVTVQNVGPRGGAGEVYPRVIKEKGTPPPQYPSVEE
jgi:hypothetical protein